jgi:hypothetical protein
VDWKELVLDEQSKAVSDMVSIRAFTSSQLDVRFECDMLRLASLSPISGEQRELPRHRRRAAERD